MAKTITVTCVSHDRPVLMDEDGALRHGDGLQGMQDRCLGDRFRVEQITEVSRMRARLALSDSRG